MKDSKYYEDLEKKGYFEELDKRSKEYREYKQWLKAKESYKNLKENVEKDTSIGLGDVVESITKATGIKKVVEAITDDCGCDERKEKLNKIHVWKKRNVQCVKEEDYEWLKENVKESKSRYTFEERERLVNIYNYIYNTKEKNSNCSSCIRGLVKTLRRYLEVYDS